MYPKRNDWKWDKKGEKKILVDYSENVKGYRVYDVKDHSISVSRDVIGFEDVKNNVTSESEDKGTEVSEEVAVSVGESQKSHAEHNPIIEMPDSSSDSDGAFDSMDDSSSDADGMFDNNDNSYVPEVEVTQNQENEPRRSQRERKLKQIDDYVTYSCAASADDPITVSEAMSRPDAEKWK